MGTCGACDSQPKNENSNPRWLPAVDVFESQEELLLAVDLPGVEASKVDLRFHGGALQIVAPRKEAAGEFRRSFQIAKGYDGERVRAEHKDGVLKVYIPKIAAAQPRKIDVVAS